MSRLEVPTAGVERRRRRETHRSGALVVDNNVARRARPKHVVNGRL